MPPCDRHDEIVKKLDTILERLGDGDVSFATLKLRVEYIERIVYGAVALSLTALGGAALGLVVKGG